MSGASPVAGSASRVAAVLGGGPPGAPINWHAELAAQVERLGAVSDHELAAHLGATRTEVRKALSVVPAPFASCRGRACRIYYIDPIRLSEL